MPKRTDREADYMCFSPVRRKTSKLEREEEYTSRLVSRNFRDKIKSTKVARFNLVTESREKIVKKLFIFVTDLKMMKKSKKQ
jgi:PP-loop superfamily ATP-utilizing enzyme